MKTLTTTHFIKISIPGARKHRGSKSRKWNPLLTDKERAKKRDEGPSREWRVGVYERDDYTCRDCGHRGHDLHAHHIIPYAQEQSTRFAVENGITLCVKCHRLFHTQYGYRYPRNTFENWLGTLPGALTRYIPVGPIA